MSRAALCAVGIALIVSGCATEKAVPGPMTGVAADTFPAPDPAPAVARQNYKIAAGDSISVAVFRVPELTRSGVVSSGGTFFIPQIGDVALAGKTSEEASSTIAAALRNGYVVDPQVTVEIKPANAEEYTIEGAVTAPGLYNITDDLTLLKAMAAAKGPVQSGSDLRRVVVFRVIKGVKTANVYDLADIRAGKADDPRVYANDLIQVPIDNRYDTVVKIIGAIPVFSLFFR